jgi:hypothetical protein
MSVCGPLSVGRPRACGAASHKHVGVHELLTAATRWGLNLVDLRPQASRALHLLVALPRAGGTHSCSVFFGVWPLGPCMLSCPYTQMDHMYMWAGWVGLGPHACCVQTTIHLTASVPLGAACAGAGMGAGWLHASYLAFV